MKHIINFFLIAITSIILISPSKSQTINTIAGTGVLFNVPENSSALEAQLGEVSAVAADQDGNLYVASIDAKKIYKIDGEGIITRVIGTGESSTAGDGGPAIEAGTNQPCGLAIDADGNIYISEKVSGRVRKIDTAGIVTAVAGSNGSYGYSGDGGPATEASLNDPAGIAVDADGNVYIADLYNHRIRKVDTAGIITTVAGTGTYGFSGDGGLAVEAQLHNPFDVAVDVDGNLYIADGNNRRIRKVDTNGTITTLIDYNAINSELGPLIGSELDYYMSMFLTFDTEGNLYFSAQGDYRVRKLDTQGNITTVAGNGQRGFSGDGLTATSASFNIAAGLTVNSNGELFIADIYNGRVRKVDDQGIMTTYGGTGVYGFSGDGDTATTAQLHTPVSSVIDAQGNLFIADRNNYRIRRVDPNGIITTIAGNGLKGSSGDGGAAVDAKINGPADMVLDVQGNLYFADAYNHRIRKIDPDGVITTVAGNGIQNNYGFGTYTGDGGPATEAGLNRPNGLAIDNQGNLYIADSQNDCIRKIDSDGIITTIVGNGTSGYNGDSIPATSAYLYHPTDVEVDSEGNIYIADLFNERIRKVDTNNLIFTIAGGPESSDSGDWGPANEALFKSPESLTLDSEGNIYIADKSSYKVRRIDHESGIITTVAGVGYRNYSPERDNIDGTLATEAFIDPRHVMTDSLDNLYIVNTGGHRVHMVNPDTTAPQGYSASFYKPYLNAESNINRVYFSIKEAEEGMKYEFTIQNKEYEEIVSGSGTTNVNKSYGPFDLSTLNEGELTLSVKLTDVYGNTGEIVTSTILKDITPPTVIAKDFTAYLDSDGEVVISADSVNDGSWDNVSAISLELDQSLFSWYQLGENTVYLTATDSADNSASVQAVITVADTISPTFNCLPNVASKDGSVEDIALQDVFDNCRDPKITYVLSGATTGSGTGDASKETFNKGITTVTYTVSDESGNNNSCSFQVDYLYLNTESKRDQFISFYPNPVFNGKLILENAANFDFLQITDQSGRTLLSQSIDESNFKLDVSSLKHGVYIIQFTGKAGNKFEKLIIQQ